MKVLLHKAVGADFYSKVIELPFAPTDGTRVKVDGIIVTIYQPVWDISKGMFESARVPDNYAYPRKATVRQPTSDIEIGNLNRSGWERRSPLSSKDK